MTEPRTADPALPNRTRRRAARVLGLLLIMLPSALAGQSRSGRSDWPQLASGAVAINASIGATIAVRNDLRQEPFGIRTGRTARDDFFFGTGTALSPGLPFLLTQAVSTALASGNGRSRRFGLIGLAVHGIGYTVGGLAEPITYERLRHPTEEPFQTMVVIGNFVWPVLLAVTAIRELR